MVVAWRRLLPRLAAIVACLVATATAANADPLRIYAAGSLTEAVKELIEASGFPAADIAQPVFGPAGLLRQRIERGEGADLFASADLAQPQRLADKGLALPPVPFARNRMCVVGKPALGLTAENLLDKLLLPETRLATSTPDADPGGDYALAVFDRADRIHPGAGQTLRDKAMKLLGAPSAMVPVNGKSPAASVFIADRADALLYYCSGVAATLREVPTLVSVPLPPALEVGPVYGLAVLGRNQSAMQFALFMLSSKGQAILARHDLLPIAGEAPSQNARTAGLGVPADRIAIVTPTGSETQLTADTLAKLAFVTSTASFATEHGRQEASFDGPLLWDVLAQGGAVDASRPREQVRGMVLLEGRDGYMATLALGEIGPAFEGKQVILAERMNGRALEPGHWRIVVPADQRGGRSVRDIARITVTAGP